MNNPIQPTYQKIMGITANTGPQRTASTRPPELVYLREAPGMKALFSKGVDWTQKNISHYSSQNQFQHSYFLIFTSHQLLFITIQIKKSLKNFFFFFFFNSLNKTFLLFFSHMNQICFWSTSFFKSFAKHSQSYPENTWHIMTRLGVGVTPPKLALSN